MKKPKNSVVRKYHNACLKIAEKFWNKYYHIPYEVDFTTALKESFYPVGGIPSDIWEVEAHQWWSVEDMATAIEYGGTKEQIEEWYWNTIGETDTTKTKHQNLKNFLKYGWINPKISKEEDERLKASIEKAKNDLEIAINSYK